MNNEPICNSVVKRRNDMKNKLSNMTDTEFNMYLIIIQDDYGNLIVKELHKRWNNEKARL